MAWFAIDDGFDTHPKVRKAGNAAIGLFVRLGSHAAKHLTEGHLDGAVVRDYGTPATIRKLIAVGMLHEMGHGCRNCPPVPEGSFYIHDYLDYNKSRGQVQAAREAARKRQQKGRDTARANRNLNDSEPKLARNSRENGASFASNSRENGPRFEGETPGQGGESRRYTLEGEAGVPSHPLPSPNYNGADLGGEGDRSRDSSHGADAPAPIEIDGFRVTDTMRRWAVAHYPALDIEHSTAQFISHYRSTGARRKSWPDAWQKWIRDDANRPTRRPTANGFQLPNGQTLTGTDAKVAGWLALAAKYDNPETA